jgi:hypothetical protein
VTVIPVLTDDLYHYTSADIGLGIVMTQMQLRLGLAEFMNDPRESRPRFPPLEIPEGVSEDTRDLWHETDRLLRRAAKVACFTLDYEVLESVLDPQAQRGYTHPALWAHYGGRHAGVCLRFSRRALAERMREALTSRGQLFYGAVDYTSDLFSDLDASSLNVGQVNEFGLDAVVFRYIEQHHRELFFQKHSDWSNEQEYRWVLIDPVPLPAFVDITGCLTGVVLGDSFDEAQLEAVHHLAERSDGLHVSRVKFQNGRPNLVPVPLTPKTPRASLRPGTLDERVCLLAAAEAEAEEARARGEHVAAPVVARIQSAVWQIAAQALQLTAVEVDVHRSITAVPPSERRTAPGVGRYSTEYESGAMCVVENLPRYSLTFVASAAVQVLAGGRLKLHAAFTLERWLSTGNEHEELWRFADDLELDLSVAEKRAEGMSATMRDRLEPALSTFDERRAPLRRQIEPARQRE